MPIPQPNKDKENLSSFINRFMANKTMKEEFTDIKQRLAVAYSKYRDKKPKK